MDTVLPFDSHALNALIDVLEYMVGESAKRSRGGRVLGGSPTPLRPATTRSTFEESRFTFDFTSPDPASTSRDPRPRKKACYSDESGDADSDATLEPATPKPIRRSPVSREERPSPIQKFRAGGSSPVTRATPDAYKLLVKEDAKGLRPRRPLTDAEAAHKVLVTLRDTVDPRGAEFMALVDAIFSATPKAPLQSREMTELLAEHGARSKYILRKLAFSLVPNSKDARVAFIRQTMKLADVKTEENQVTKQEAYEIIKAAYALDPTGIRIPELHSRAQTAQAMYLKDC